MTTGVPTTMRRVVVESQGIRVVTAPTPQPEPHEVLVRSAASGVCGSDTHAAHGRHPFVALPYHPGHEVVGVVAQVGTAVSALQPGDRVTVEPDLPCWDCKMCRSGRQNLCERLQFFGCGYAQGGMADYFTIDARRVHVLPDRLDLVDAALIEPLSTPVHAVRLAGGVEGRTVVVIGAGSIGLLLLRVVVAGGARRIVVTDPLPAKRDLALRLGAHAVVDATAEDASEQVRAALGESADVVFDCVAIASTVDRAIAMADKGGTVVVVGVPAADVSVPLAVIQDHQIRLQGSATYLPVDYADATALLVGGQIPVHELVTAVVPMDEVASAFAMSASGDHVKVLVSINPDLLERRSD